MKGTFRGMTIDEDAEELNISDHNLVRAWFKIGRVEKARWEKKKYETIIWYKKD